MEIKANLYINVENMVNMEAQSGDGLENTSMQTTGIFTMNEMAAVNLIADILRALVDGKRLNRFYNPEEKNPIASRLMKCLWTKSGYLQVVEHTTIRMRAHATTVAEAMSRQRTFTCTPDLYNLLEKRRPSGNVKTTRDKQRLNREEGIRQTMAKIPVAKELPGINLPVTTAPSNRVPITDVSEMEASLDLDVPQDETGISDELADELDTDSEE